MKTRVGCLFLYAAGEELGVGHKQVVADDLDLAAETLHAKLFPTVPVCLVKAVFEGRHWVFLDELLIEVDHLLARPLRVLLGGQDVLPVFVEGAGSGIDGNGHILAGLIACLLDGLHNELERLGIGLEVGCKPASSPTPVAYHF